MAHRLPPRDPKTGQFRKAKHRRNPEGAEANPRRKRKSARRK